MWFTYFRKGDVKIKVPYELDQENDVIDIYQCPNCKLEFSIGQFHYDVFRSGYDSMTLCICMKCGSSHAIEHAIETIKENIQLKYSPEGILQKRKKKIDKFLYTDGECNEPDEDTEWIEQNVLGGTVGDTEQFQLSEQQCGHCSTKGHIVHELPCCIKSKSHFINIPPEDVDTCPKCGKSNLVCTGGWMT